MAATIEQMPKVQNLERSFSTTHIVATGSTLIKGTIACFDANKKLIDGNASFVVAGEVIELSTTGTDAQIRWDHGFWISLPGVAQTDIGSLAYLVDNNTATLTPATAILGHIIQVGTDECCVRVDKNY